MTNYTDPTKPDMRALQPCPSCRESNVDMLIWDDPDNIDGPVTCVSCGTRYYPNLPEVPPQQAS